MEYGLIRTNTDEYGRGFGSLTAMRSRNSKVHGTQYAMYSPLRTTPYTSVPIRTRLRCATPWQAGIAHSIGSAPVFASLRRGKQSALPANSTRSHALQKFKSTWHSVCHVLPSPYYSVHIRTYPYPSSLRYAAASKVPCQPTVHAAMCFGNTGAHSTHCPLYPCLYLSVQVRIRPYSIAHSIGIALPEVREPHF